MAEDTFKSGFVSIVGRPNVGKSTLLNHLVGEKVVITSKKPQTTRNAIHGILTTENYQIIFIDTPGIHKPRNKLGEYMVETAIKALREVDVVVFMSEIQKQVGPGDLYIVETLKKIKTPVIALLNKKDLKNQDEIEESVSVFSNLMKFYRIIPISALFGINCDKVTKTLVELLPLGPKYYPENMVTNQPEQLIVAELIREKILNLIEQEVPHGTAVEVVSFDTQENKDIIHISANIYCEKESHKGIIIGKGGRKLKEIGTQARQDIENLLGTKVFLDLWVKVSKNWREKEGMIRNLGYRV
ncbi:MAG: GTPase [Thermosediminibacterales bacterium]|nr:GTPase [Thermosediminibacterales bacterium]MDK2835644.1 GTPase [Thermosediminibacterales bacterium]